MQDLEKVDEVKVQETIRDQHETIMSVDDAVDAILTALGDRASNTLFIFSGDNGLQRGDHRLNGKNVPYQSALNVQMLMRWDGVIQPGSKDENPITNEDLPVTMAAAADTVLDGAKGTSALAPLNTRPGVYIEGAAQEGAPGWIGWRTRRHMYCNFGEGQGEELYDYDDDKWELDNIASTAPKTLASLRNRTLSADHPLPPGFTPYKP
jgi:arylsulfatase A-like enzyme